MKNRRAKVVYSYAPQNEDELKLEVDDVIEILDEIEEGWWKGISTKGITGVFPSNFVVEVTSDSPKNNKKDLSDKSDNDSIDSSNFKRDDSLEKKPKPIAKVGFGDIFAGGIKPKLTPIGDSSADKNKSLPKKPPPPTPVSDAEPAPKLPPKPVREQARVLYAYEAQNDDELTIKEGEMINIISKDIEDVGWWKGELNGRIALFPDNFVELLKTTEELSSTPRLKKPDRPSEKPPPPLSNSPKISNILKSDSTKSSNKPSEELPKTSNVLNSSGVNPAPVIPEKKPKVLNSSIFQPKPKPEPTQTPIPSTGNVKPDVVPQENGSKADKEIESNGNNSSIDSTSENHFNSIDSTGNKLTHLTAQRVKGPSSRRPPSTIFIPKESANESKENGDISTDKVSALRNDLNSNHSSDQLKTSLSKTPPEKQVEKLPPWMVELRKAQEKRKEPPEELPKEKPDLKGPLHSPTKTSPNRFSGEFSNKAVLQTSTSEDNSGFKPPLKPAKPNITSVVSAVSAVSSVSSVSAVTTAETATPVSTVTTTNTTSKTTNIVISSATTTSTPIPTPITAPKVEESVSSSKADDTRDVSELERELRAIKESTVSRRDFDELVKQVNELKDLVETQKQSYSKIIKDLINDVAEERKTLATLQIEIDRLRRLTTTV